MPHFGRSPPLVNKPLGIVLCALGVFGLIWGGFTYHTQQTVFSIGSLHATREAAHKVLLPPVVGALALIAGVFVLAAGRGKSA